MTTDKEVVKISLIKTGEKIRKLRLKRGLSVNHLCELLECSDPNTIYHWEHGRNLPNVTFLFKMSRIFNVSMDDIIKMED